jgi:hypothetical protein
MLSVVDCTIAHSRSWSFRAFLKALYDNNKNGGHSNVGYIKPFTYDGKTDWANYKVHFETVSKLNQWADEVKVLKLVSSMQGAALIAHSRSWSFRAFLKALYDNLSWISAVAEG